jgi:hypothetical protein
MWKVTLVMINFAGLGDGAAACGGVSTGVGAVLGVGPAAAFEGVLSGEFVGCWPVGCWVQAASTNTIPAASAAGITPLLSLP